MRSSYLVRANIVVGHGIPLAGGMQLKIYLETNQIFAGRLQPPDNSRFEPRIKLRMEMTILVQQLFDSWHVLRPSAHIT